jgi:hypothetical protein
VTDRDALIAQLREPFDVREMQASAATLDALTEPANRMGRAATMLKADAERIAALEQGLRAAIKIADEAAEEWDKAPQGMRAGKILLALAGHRKGYRPDIDAIHALLGPPQTPTYADRIRALETVIDKLSGQPPAEPPHA